MNRAVLDTDILSDILRGKEASVEARARAYRAKHRHLTFTVASVIEVVRGLTRAGATFRVQRFLSILSRDEVLPLDTQTAVLAGRIDADLLRAGRPIGVADVIVAAIALQHGLALVTGNQAHFRYVRDVGYPLQLENWRVG